MKLLPRALPWIRILFVLIAIASQCNGQDWSQWRGPTRDGIARNFSAPARWPEQLKEKWRVEVGIGHSSPVVSGQRVFVLSRQGDREVVSCFDLGAGRMIWQDSYPVAYTMNPAAVIHGKGPKSTPIIDNGRLFTLGITGVISCYDASTGSLKWRKEFSKEFKQTSPDYGTAMSPLVYKGRLVAHVGGNDSGALVALDVNSGDLKWKWGGDGPGYASPIVVTTDGVEQIVTQSQKFIVGVSPANGELLWSIPFETEYVQNIVTPAAYKDLLILSGLDKGTMAVRVARKNGKWTPEQVWKNPDVSMYMNSPVVIGDAVYGLSHKRKGQLFCLDARTGKTLWTSAGREGDNAAVVSAPDLMFVLTDSAELTLVRTNPAHLEVVKKYTVAKSPTWAHPVLTGNGLLIKDVSSLALLSLQ